MLGGLWETATKWQGWYQTVHLVINMNFPSRQWVMKTCIRGLSNKAVWKEQYRRGLCPLSILERIVSQYKRTLLPTITAHHTISFSLTTAGSIVLLAKSWKPPNVLFVTAFIHYVAEQPLQLPLCNHSRMHISIWWWRTCTTTQPKLPAQQWWVTDVGQEHLTLQSQLSTAQAAKWGTTIWITSTKHLSSLYHTTNNLP
jgi:hypothetical protein